jgi:hypothetical protein
MSFADLRRSALAFGALSTGAFAELVTIADYTGNHEVTAKIEHDSPRDRSRRENDTVDTMERIRVTVEIGSGDLQLPKRPQPAATLMRSAARDPEQKPFQFADEIVYEGEVHAAYIFTRPRRIAQGRRVR